MHQFDSFQDSNELIQFLNNNAPIWLIPRLSKSNLRQNGHVQLFLTAILSW